MSDTLIKVEGVSKKFCKSLKKSLWYGMQDLGREITGRKHGGDGELRPDEFWAVNDVSFELKRGECLGLIGGNGAGKTTLLRMLNGLIKPDRGRIEMRGRVGALIALGAGFNPVLTGRENIYVNASVLGLTRQEIDAKLDEIIDFAEIGEFIDMPVQSYSSGMSVRLGFSVATALNPDILILDEVLAVGDRRFSHKCFNRIGKIRENGAATLLVSHSEHQLERFCNGGMVLSRGALLYRGDINNALRLYRFSETEGTTLNHNSTVKLRKIKREHEIWGQNQWQVLISIDSTNLDLRQVLAINNEKKLWLEIVLRSEEGIPIVYFSKDLEPQISELRDALFLIKCDLILPEINSVSLVPSYSLWNQKKTHCFANDQGTPLIIWSDRDVIGLIKPLEYSLQLARQECTKRYDFL